LRERVSQSGDVHSDYVGGASGDVDPVEVGPSHGDALDHEVLGALRFDADRIAPSEPWRVTGPGTVTGPRWTPGSSVTVVPGAAWSSTRRREAPAGTLTDGAGEAETDAAEIATTPAIASRNGPAMRLI
jgi:hypothetical protein